MIKEVLAKGVELYLGDCLDIIPKLENIRSVITDPPFGIADTAGGAQSRARTKGNYSSIFPDTQEYVADVCANAIRQCIKASRNVALTTGRKNMWYYPPPDEVGCFFQPAASGVSTWGRPTWQPILFYGNPPNSGEQVKHLHYVLTEIAHPNGHPCPKPIRAWTWLVEKASKAGDVVLDPFMGSGTTGVACINTERKFIGIEIDPNYFDIARRRLLQTLEKPDFWTKKSKPIKKNFRQIWGLPERT